MFRIVPTVDSAGRIPVTVKLAALLYLGAFWDGAVCA